MYEECREATAHFFEAQEARARIDRFTPPHLDYYRGLAEAKEQAAKTALKAHRMSLCSCAIREAARQPTYTAANNEELPEGAPGTTIVNDGRPT